jgi:predicted AAA+ superfamily ATPase
MVIERTKYLDDIEKYKDKHVIKILVGTRRVGKSFILKSFKKLLVEKYVVNEKQIISLDFNDKLIVKKYD